MCTGSKKDGARHDAPNSRPVSTAQRPHKRADIPLQNLARDPKSTAETAFSDGTPVAGERFQRQRDLAAQQRSQAKIQRRQARLMRQWPAGDENSFGGAGEPQNSANSRGENTSSNQSGGTSSHHYGPNSFTFGGNTFTATNMQRNHWGSGFDFNPSTTHSSSWSAGTESRSDAGSSQPYRGTQYNNVGGGVQATGVFSDIYNFPPR